MLTPERLLRFTIELIFVLLGFLVIWLGLARRIYVDRHSTAWLILSVALILWGLRALYGDIARAVCLGRSDAGGRRWPARTARYDWGVLDLPAPLKKRLPRGRGGRSRFSRLLVFLSLLLRL